MAEIVNLRLARKARNRAADKARAEQNRARHGRSLAEREASEAESERLSRSLEGARRVGDEDDA